MASCHEGSRDCISRTRLPHHRIQAASQRGFGKRPRTRRRSSSSSSSRTTEPHNVEPFICRMKLLPPQWQHIYEWKSPALCFYDGTDENINLIAHSFNGHFACSHFMWPLYTTLAGSTFRVRSYKFYSRHIRSFRTYKMCNFCNISDTVFCFFAHLSCSAHCRRARS